MSEPPELEQEAKYMRLVAGKVVYISAAETMKEEILARPRGELSDQAIIVFEWNDRVKVAEQLRERISVIYQMIENDPQNPSQYELDYRMLWGQYRDAIEDLRELDSEWVSQFRDKVAARVKELEVRVNTIYDNLDNWDPDDFEDLEKLLASYEKNFDLSVALASGPVPKSKTHMPSSLGGPPATTISEGEKVTGEKYLSKREFNERFLWELASYPKKVAQDLLRECKHDIRFESWRYTQRRWGSFIFLDKLTEIEHAPPSKTSIERKLKRMLKEETYARELPVCDYGDGSVQWANCLPCPLYKDGHCLSRGAAAYRAIHEKQQEEATDEVVKAKAEKPPDETILECPQIPIEKLIRHHRKRKVTLQGPDGRVIDWLWCLSTWDKLGRPVIYASLGDPFYDLSLYFYPEKLSPRRLQGIVNWLEEHSNGRAHGQSLEGG